MYRQVTEYRGIREGDPESEQRARTLSTQSSVNRYQTVDSCLEMVKSRMRACHQHVHIQSKCTHAHTYICQIAEAYKKKIESIVRKPTKQEEDEPVTPCPYCAFK